MPPAERDARARRSRLGRIALFGAVVAALLLALPGPLHRSGVEFGALFQMLQIGTIAAALFLLIGLVALALAFARHQRKWPSLAAVAITGVALAFILPLAATGRSVPPIHDITTDMDNPPQFVAVLPLRADAPNPPDYDPAVAEQQRAAYADVRPLRLDVPPAEAFARVQQAANARGWDLVDADAAEGRLEATETTQWFGFKDDVVVRVQPDGSGGSIVDVRSKSRMGMSDLGANAERIRALLADLRG